VHISTSTPLFRSSHDLFHTKQWEGGRNVHDILSLHQAIMLYNQILCNLKGSYERKVFSIIGTTHLNFSMHETQIIMHISTSTPLFHSSHDLFHTK